MGGGDDGYTSDGEADLRGERRVTIACEGDSIFRGEG